MLASRAFDESAEQLYEQAPCGYLSTAADGTIVRINQTLLGWLGYARDDLVGRRGFSDLLSAGPRVMWQTHHLALLQSIGAINGVSLELVRADAARVPVLAGAVLATVEGESAPLVRITLFDARERMEYERSLVAARVAAETSERRAHTLQRMTQACAAGGSPEQLLDGIAHAAAEALEALGAAVWLPVEGTEGLRRVATCDLDDVLAPPQLGPASASPLFHAWTTGELAVVDAPEQHQDEPTLLALPLTEGPDAVGVLGVYLTHSRPIDAAERAVLTSIGLLVAGALARARLHTELRRLALHDPLTGLPNRVLLADRAAHALRRASRGEKGVAVLMVDLDGFKEVNDTLGHAAGDAVLRTCAERLLGAVRDADTVARLGGDEFAILCEDADAAAAVLVAERVRTALAGPLELGGSLATVTGSVGAAVSTDGSASLEELLADADAAMYTAKGAGKNQSALHPVRPKG